MSIVSRGMDFSRSSLLFALFLMLAVVAFWPSYVSQPFASSSGYIHLHAATATLWMALLVAQPLAIRNRRFALHRALGRLSWILAPLVLVSIVLLANSRIRGAPVGAYAIQTYILYLQVSLAVLFALSWLAGILTRRRMPLHARFMACTAVTLIDPILVRLLLWFDPTPDWNYQWLTFGVTDLVLLSLIWRERHATQGRGVFPAMLVLFVIVQAPALTGWTQDPAWQSFARWFAALPLT